MLLNLGEWDFPQKKVGLSKPNSSSKHRKDPASPRTRDCSRNPTPFLAPLLESKAAM